MGVAWVGWVNEMGHWAWMHFGYWMEGKRAAVLQGSWHADWKREIVASLAGVPELGCACSPRAYMGKVMRLRQFGAIAWGTQISGRLNPRCGDGLHHSS